jgi:16S rRNA A1518/A1519 N6-dimethyltransferase RsmA/KsgA/DIM1 with predicted DNA glycosylase/AP lyase activity
VQQDPGNDYIAAIRANCDITGKDILEIGCGKGRITRDLAQHARLVVATDPDPLAI